MPTLIATAGASNANSYCTVAEADTYHETHLYATAWTDADDDNKAIALIWATRLLDDTMAWNGTPTDSTQALRWPRFQVLDREGINYLPDDVIPVWLKNATAEFARQLISADRTADRGYGIKSVQADVVSMEFDKQDVKPVLPESVISMVRLYGEVGGSSGASTYTMKLERA